jgi:type 1 glutamine amidotransferase
MRSTAALLFSILIYTSITAQQNENKLKNKNVLIFTKNGKGYVHENIPASIVAIQGLGKKFNFHVDTTTDASRFKKDILNKYDVIIFSNTNNDVFDSEEEKVAFMRYIEAGGGFMGIHSASGTERNWKWFKLMLGATFLRHPPFQSLTVHVLDPKHPATKNLPVSWQTQDECYYFKEFNPDIKVLLFTDLSQVNESADGKNIKPDVFGNKYPTAWCHEFDGGKIWYTALGHNKEDYTNPTYLAHIIEGLKWVIDKGELNYSKAYAISSEIDEMKLF